MTRHLAILLIALPGCAPTDQASLFGSSGAPSLLLKPGLYTGSANVSGGLRSVTWGLRSARPTERNITDSRTGWYMNRGQASSTNAHCEFGTDCFDCGSSSVDFTGTTTTTLKSSAPDLAHAPAAQIAPLNIHSLANAFPSWARMPW